MRCHFGRVVLVAEYGRKDLMFISTARADLTSCQAVADLREDQRREYRYDREAHLIVKLQEPGLVAFRLERMHGDRHSRRA